MSDNGITNSFQTAELEALGAHCITIAVKSTAAPGTTTAVHVTSTTSMRSAPFLTDPDDNVLNKFVQHVQGMNNRK